MTILYIFRLDVKPRIDQHLSLESDAQAQALKWLREWLADSKPSSLQLGSVLISRALFTRPEEPASPPTADGISIEWPDRRLGLKRAAVKAFAADLKHERPGVYDGISAEETIPVRDLP